jgi:hypothetical protein
MFTASLVPAYTSQRHFDRHSIKVNLWVESSPKLFKEMILLCHQPQCNRKDPKYFPTYDTILLFRFHCLQQNAKMGEIPAKFLGEESGYSHLGNVEALRNYINSSQYWSTHCLQLFGNDSVDSATALQPAHTHQFRGRV